VPHSAPVSARTASDGFLQSQLDSGGQGTANTRTVAYYGLMTTRAPGVTSS